MGPAVVGSGQRYRPAELLSEDRLGTLWRGTDQWSAAPVVVRLLDDRLTSDPRALQRAITQIRSAQVRVSNPHVARVLDFDLRRQREFRAFVVYEGFAGEPLARRLERRTPVPADRALRLIAGIADALAAAHAAWIYHSALTAASVLADADVVRVLDLGLGELAANGDAAVPGANLRDRGPADVLAVGLLFEQLLLGTPERPAARESDAPRAWEGRVPPDLGVPLRRALSPYRLQRPDMEELAAALAPALAGTSAPDPEVPPDAAPVAFSPPAGPTFPAPPERAPELGRAAGRSAVEAPAPSEDRSPRVRAARHGRRRILVSIAAAAVLVGGVTAGALFALRDSDATAQDGGRDRSPAATDTTSPTPTIVRATVPDALGLRLGKAVELIEEAGLVVGSITTVPGEARIVIRTDPTPGEAVVGGAPVNLSIGSGAEP